MYQLGRAYAAAITALMTGRAYRKSAEISARMGAFSEYERNRQPMVRVIEKHRAAVGNIEDRETIAVDLVDAARGSWDEALDLGREHGIVDVGLRDAARGIGGIRGRCRAALAAAVRACLEKSETA